MIVRINKGKNPGGAVRYNEAKVGNGEARLLVMQNYPGDDFSVGEKIAVLDAQVSLNPRISEPTVHIALAFHPSETLSDDELTAIATDYMEAMGYGEQPMLVYRHEDTQHPHLHIVTVNIDSDGKKITDSNDQYRSNAIRKKIELTYNLVKAEEQQRSFIINTHLPETLAEYGKEETKKAIGTVVQTAFKDYSFSSLAEFDRFIRHHGVQMNVREGGGELPWKGLTFQLLAQNVPVSREIKASAYHFAPTLNNLRHRFQSGSRKKAVQQASLTGRIQEVIAPYQTITQDDFMAGLRNKDIQVLDDGQSYVYVDHKNRTVYSEENLGKSYTRQHLSGRYATAHSLLQGMVQHAVESLPQPATSQPKPTAYDQEAANAALGRLVSKHYQLYKKELGITFESQLIAQFPFGELVRRLRAEGKPETLATAAVSEFERYKRSELAQINAKEQAYFEQTVKAILPLAESMPISGVSRLQFLARMDLVVRLNQAGQTHIEHLSHQSLQVTLSPTDYRSLETDRGKDIVLPAQLSREEKLAFRAVALGQPLPNVNLPSIRLGLFKNTLLPSMLIPLAQQLNTTWLAKLTRDPLLGDEQLLDRLYTRGIVVTSVDGEYRAGLQATPTQSYAPLPASWQAVLQRKGLPLDYAISVDRLITQLGQLLTRWVQHGDFGNAKTQAYYQERLVALVPTAQGLRGEALLKTSLEALGNMPGDMLRGTNKEQSINKPATNKITELDRLLFTAYVAHRRETGQYFESTLLKVADSFPDRALTTYLTDKHAVSFEKAVEVVASFRNKRLDQLPAIEAKDRDRFDRSTIGYTRMVGEAPLTVGDKLAVIKALHLRLERTTSGDYELNHDTDRSFKRRLTSDEATKLLTAAKQPQRIELPSVEFPRYEREYYEKMALGGVLKHNPTDNYPINLLMMDTARAKVLIGEINWDKSSTWLNEQTMPLALIKAPVNSVEKVRWLYQRGIVVHKTEKGYALGHYQTKTDTFVDVDKGLTRLLRTMEFSLPTTQQQLEAATSQRGQSMQKLAIAMDGGNDRRIRWTVEQIVGQLPTLAPLASQPARLLEALTDTYGPHRVIKDVGKSAYSTNPEGAVPGTQTDNASILASAMSQHEVKKKRKGVGDSVRHRKPRR